LEIRALAMRFIKVVPLCQLATLPETKLNMWPNFALCLAVSANVFEHSLQV